MIVKDYNNTTENSMFTNKCICSFNSFIHSFIQCLMSNKDFNQDGVTGTTLTLPPETVKNTDKIYGMTVFKTLDIKAMEDGDP